MQYHSVKGHNGWSQLSFLFIFTAIGFALAFIVQLVILLMMVPAGMPLDKIAEAAPKAMLDPANVGYARVSQVLGTFFLLFVPALLYMLLSHGKNFFWLGFNKYINGWQILLGFFLIFLANVLANPVADLSKMLISHFPSVDAWAKQLEDAYTEQVLALSNLKSWGEFLMAIVIMAFFPALFEEIFFRGALQTLLERWWKKPLLALIAASLVFSLIHLSVYLFLSRALLGFVLGLMYQRSKNIWVNVIAHFLNNTVAAIQMFWISRNTEKIEVDKLDPKVPIWGALIALAITVALFWLFERVSGKNRKQIAFKEQDLYEHKDLLHAFPENKKP
ncbi:MAG TPA: type II CAAX endopeptidase family protein [Ferruginibacter sp.]|nr:type II CAAX endopeptidase family protein [Ferruginibacter sp.]